MAKVSQTAFVEKNFLDDERGDGLRELSASLHDAQAQRNYLGLKQESDHLGVVDLDKGPDDTKRCEPKVLK